MRNARIVDQAHLRRRAVSCCAARAVAVGLARQAAPLEVLRRAGDGVVGAPLRGGRTFLVATVTVAAALLVGATARLGIRFATYVGG